jgi:hypothetical protein
MQESDFEKWREIVEKLDKAGFTKNPVIFKVCKQCWEGNCRPLRELLRRRTSLLRKAERKIAEMEDYPFWPPPLKQSEIEKIRGKYSVGIVNHRKDTAGLNNPDFTRGLLPIGAQGTGKTWASLRILDMMLGLPPKERGFNVIIIQRMKRDSDGFAVKYPWFKVLEWSDLRYNMWQVDEWDNPHDKLASANTIFCGENFLYSLTVPPMRYAVKKCYEENGVFENSNNFPVFSEIMAKLPGYTKAYNIKGYEMTSSIGRLTNRLVDFIEEGKILNCKNGLPLSFFLEHDLCINVMDQNEFTVRATIMNILYDIQRYLQKKPISRPALRVLTYIDEARWLFDIKRDNMDIASNKILEDWFTTCRESGYGRIISTQEPESVSRFVRSNCAFRLSFPIFGEESVKAVKGLHTLTDEEASFLRKLKPYGEGIFSHPNFDRPFLITIPPELDLDKSVTREKIAQMMRPFFDQIHAELDLDEGEVIEPIDLNEIEKRANDQKIGVLILRKLKDNPFLHYTQLMTLIKSEYGISKENVDSALNWLEKDQELIITIKARGSKTRATLHFPMTIQAQTSLGIPASQQIAPLRFKHTLYCKRLRSFLMSEGHEAILEYTEGEPEATIITKSGKQLKIPKRIDVMSFQNGKMVAFEVVLSFSNIAQTIFKCLKLFKVDELHIVCERKAPELDKAMKIVSEKVPGYLFERITWDTMTQFF